MCVCVCVGGGGVQKIESLWRMQILWILFWRGGGHHKTRLFFGSFLCIYRSFSSSMYRTGIFFVGCLFVVVVVFFEGWGVNSRSLV